MIRFEWCDKGADGLVGEVDGEGGGRVEITRLAPRYPNGDLGVPYWIVNIRPRYGLELTLPERFATARAARSAAEAWFDARPPEPRGPRRWRPVPNQPA